MAGPSNVAISRQLQENIDLVILSSDESNNGSDIELIETSKEMEDDINEKARKYLPNLMSMFPEASPLYIKTLLVHDMYEKNLSDDRLINNIVNHLLQNPYPTVTDPMHLPSDQSAISLSPVQTVKLEDENDEAIDVTENNVENVKVGNYNDDNLQFVCDYVNEELIDGYLTGIRNESNTQNIEWPVNDLAESNESNIVCDYVNEKLIEGYLAHIRNESNTQNIEWPIVKSVCSVKDLPESNESNTENIKMPIIASVCSLKDLPESTESNTENIKLPIIKSVCSLKDLPEADIPFETTTQTQFASSVNFSENSMAIVMPLSVNENAENIIENSHDNKMKDEEIDSTVITTSSDVDALVFKLLPIFPDACPKYLRKICAGKENTPSTLEEIITDLIQNNFPKRKQEQPTIEPELDEEEQYEIMCSVLPDADPTFLRYNCSLLINNPEEMKRFINDCIEYKNYPTMQEYKRKQQISAQVKDYTTDFNVNKFIELIPNPEQYFNDEKRTYTYVTDHKKRMHTKDILKNLFTHLKIQEITRALQMHDGKVLKTYQYLQTLPHSLKKCRKRGDMPQLYGETDIPYLQEITYVIHLKEINEEIKRRNESKQQQFEIAKELGLLLECQCCFDNELLPEDTSNCRDGGHIFCNNCIIKSVEIAFSENKTTFPCLADCSSEFSLMCLQKILKPKLFSRLALKKQLEEVKAAGIEDLESCPFCDFATIVPPNDKIFKCLNDECMRESCRICKEPSHIPLRCEEVEKPQEVKARTYIEDKMTEALLRTCWKCGLKFIKEDGCNKMSCSCGALMCYVCGKPVKDYSHFNGQGGTNYHLCPLYSDTEKLHVDAVRKVAEQAKKEIKKSNPQVKLKHDPTLNLPKGPKKDRIYQPGPAYNPQNVLQMGEGNFNVFIQQHHNHNNGNHNRRRRHNHRHNHAADADIVEVAAMREFITAVDELINYMNGDD